MTASIFRLSMLLLLWPLFGCGRIQQFPLLATTGFSGHPVTLQRVTVATMTFTRWDDVIMADTGVTLNGDGLCRFSPVITDDASTRWRPFQIYWTIFGSLSDVRNGDLMEHFFGPQDVLRAREFSKTDGVPSLGFSYISDDGARFVNLGSTAVVSDGRELRTVLSITGRQAAIRAFATTEGGRCEVKAEACVGGVECFSSGDFVPLGNIAVTQTLLGFPKEIILEPELAVVRDPSRCD